jgi:hypothetical protein
MKSIWSKIVEFLKKLLNKPTPNPSPINNISVKTPFILYGVMNTWMKLSKTEMEEWMKAQNTAKLDGIMIEFFGYSEDAWEKSVTVLNNKFLELLELARKYQQRIFLSLVNWGDDNIKKQSDEWIKDVLNWFKTNTKPSDFVGFQMASEWNDTQGSRWCGFAESILNEFPLSWNHDSRPTTATSKYSVIDYHSASTKDIQTSDKRFLNNCDHSTTLIELAGSVTAKKFDASKAQAWATTVINKGVSVGLYGYAHEKPDYNTIKALGKVRPDDSTPTEPSNDVDLTKATWQGAFKGPNAKSTVPAKNLNVNGDNISMEWNLHTWNAGDEYCDGVICCAWKMNDKWNAAYLDYCPKGRTGYKWDCLKNMANSSYEPKPIKGTECGFFIMSQKLYERSNVLLSKWPL